jgi:hypothetical protein
MKSFKEFKGNISEAPENDPKEYDYEGEMAKNDMHIITMHAQHIADMLEDETNMPEWCQSKITIAKDYLQTVCDYLHAEMNEEVDQIDEISEESEQIDELSKEKLGWYLRKAPKHMAKKGENMIKRDKKFKTGMNTLTRQIGGAVSRQDSIAKAAHKFLSKEEAEHIDEISDKLANKVLKKRVSDVERDAGVIAPNFVKLGKSVPKHERSLELYKSRQKRLNKEDSEQIDELSKDTLGRYVKKATAAKEKNWQYADAAAKRSKTPADTKQFLKHSEKFGKRTAGIKKAADKMGTEEE